MEEGVSLGDARVPPGGAPRPAPRPATGLPTRTEQGDLNLVLHAGHGAFRRCVYAPGTLEAAVFLACRAFNTADRFQVPVFLLTEQYSWIPTGTFRGFPATRPGRSATR
jgi:2-oxoglutarate ferredoxin oxidoreductase subunit alpha